MNENQRNILIGAIIAISGMLLFPPYKSDYGRAIINEGYGFLFKPPSQTANVDAGLLLAQFAGVAIIAGLLWLLAKK